MATRRRTVQQKAERPHYRGGPMGSMFVQVKRTVFRLEFGRPIERRTAIALWDSLQGRSSFDAAGLICTAFERYLATTIKIEMA